MYSCFRSVFGNQFMIIMYSCVFLKSDIIRGQLNYLNFHLSCYTLLWNYGNSSKRILDCNMFLYQNIQWYRDSFETFCSLGLVTGHLGLFRIQFTIIKLPFEFCNLHFIEINFFVDLALIDGFKKISCIFYDFKVVTIHSWRHND